jgi:hypothetical protein
VLAITPADPGDVDTALSLALTSGRALARSERGGMCRIRRLLSVERRRRAFPKAGLIPSQKDSDERPEYSKEGVAGS